MPDPVPRLTPVPFDEAIAWGKARGVVLTDDYYGDLQGIARSMAFSIAGLTKLDQLQSVLDSLNANLETGESFGQWKKRVAAGEIPLDLPPHRIENIFRTNIQGAYARGRYEQQTAVKDAFPWLMYDAVNDSRTRPAHAAMDGKVVRQDDPWLKTHRAPNGYQCRCRMIALSDAQAAQFQRADDRRMQDPEFAAARHAAQPDKGWDYDIGAEPTEGLRRAIERKRQECLGTQFAARIKGGKLQCRDDMSESLDRLEAAVKNQGKMPEPRRIDLPLLPTGKGERFYLERFMGVFGEDWNGTAIIEAPTGHQLSVSPRLFTDHKTGGTKIDKQGRSAYLLYIAETIKRPDEIWIATGSAGDAVLYLLSRFIIDRKVTGIITAFKELGRVWEGWSGYQTTNMTYFETKRDQTLLYRDHKK
jgi:SPP1 gp7 family putative phage head morphogenesis protein